MLPKSTLLAGLVVAGAASAGPLELNPNAQFDADVGGVVLRDAPPGGTVAWSPLDLAGTPGSGALRVSGPPGFYALARCAEVPALPWAQYAYAMTVRLRALGAPAAVYGDVVLMWGGDSELDGPCNRPWIGFAAAYASPSPDAELAARIARERLAVDASQQLVVNKADDADVLVDAWSLTIDADPLTADGFE